jgi:hypothetical protein
MMKRFQVLLSDLSLRRYTLASNDVFDRNLSRKLIHISSGSLFMLTWPLFSSRPEAGHGN